MTETRQTPINPILSELLKKPEHTTSTQGIPDFVEDRGVSELQEQEIDAQTKSVDDVYENDGLLASHWDRMSSTEFYPLLGLQSGTLLDLGCATGSASLDLLDRGFKVIGADLTLACLKVAATRLSAAVRADATALPFKDEAFDGLISRGALHHFQEPEASVAEAARVLKPGAPAIFTDPREVEFLEKIKHRIRKDDDNFTDDHHAFTVEEYRDLIAREFEIESVLTQDPFGILAVNAIDLIPGSDLLPAARVTKGFFKLDKLLNRTPLNRLGLIITVIARKRA